MAAHLLFGVLPSRKAWILRVLKWRVRQNTGAVTIAVWPNAHSVELELAVGVDRLVLGVAVRPEKRQGR